MKSVAFWAVLPYFLSATSALAAQTAVKKVNNLPFVLNKFIIEVDTLSNIPTKRSFARSLDAVYASLDERKVTYAVNKEFSTEGIFVGASLTLNSAQDALAVENTPGVTAIRPVKAFKQPILHKNHVVTGPTDPEIPPDALSTHIMTGVDKLHAEGYIGAGIKIGVIDSGIDYNHPALGQGFGPGHLIIGGYDFVGDNYTGSNTPVPDADPVDNCNGHGTHVAGIIAAQPGNPYNITGVAYGAKLNAYKVFGCTGVVTEEVLVDALIKAYKDGNDIITMSIGGADGWATSSSAVVANRLANLGKILTIAAGNDGASGSWFSSSPGNAYDVISVGSVENTVVPLQTAIVHGVTHAPITYFSSSPFPVTAELPIYVLSNDTTITNDGCTALPDSTPDLSNYLVIVRRGTCTFVTKLANIAKKGGKATLIYDNGNGFAAISVGSYTATLIQAEDGEFLVKQYAAGAKITISFPQTGGATNYPSKTGGLMSTFSSYGPSNDFHFKPALSAPGGNILSAIPIAMGSYGVKSGTSMATPFMAGTSALLLTVRGKTAAVSKAARDIFETTASKIPSSLTDADPLNTLTQAGAGLVNAYKAIHTTTLVSPGELILNDTAHFKGLQAFTVKNTGKTAKKYTLTHVPAGTALTIQAGSIFPAVYPVPLSNASATVTLIPSSFTVWPGQSLPVIAIFKPPTGLDASTYPAYSGFIEIASGNDTTHVSYLGLVGSLKNKEVLDNTDQAFGFTVPALLDAASDVQVNPTNYTFANGDWPSVLWRLAFGTPALRVDLVDAAINFKPTLHTRGFSGFDFFTFPHWNKGGSFAKVKVVGPLASFDYIPRDDPTSDTPYSLFNLETPTFANGTAIPAGSYRILIRALRVTGDALKEEDYESWLSPILGITP